MSRLPAQGRTGGPDPVPGLDSGPDLEPEPDPEPYSNSSANPDPIPDPGSGPGLESGPGLPGECRGRHVEEEKEEDNNV